MPARRQNLSTTLRYHFLGHLTNVNIAWQHIYYRIIISEAFIYIYVRLVLLILI